MIVGKWLKIWVEAGAIISTVGLFEAQLSTSSFQLLGMADLGLLPRVFSSRAWWFRTPWLAIVVSTALSLSISFTSFANIITSANFLYSLGMLLEFASFLWLRWRRPGIKRPFRVPLSLPGLVCMCLVPTGILVFVMLVGTWQVYAISAGLTALGIALYHAMKFCKDRGWFEFTTAVESEEEKDNRSAARTCCRQQGIVVCLDCVARETVLGSPCSVEQVYAISAGLTALGIALYHAMKFCKHRGWFEFTTAVESEEEKDDGSAARTYVLKTTRGQFCLISEPFNWTKQLSQERRPCELHGTRYFLDGVVAISSHHRALGPSWPGPVRQADVALLQGATAFQEQLRGSVSGSCIWVPAGLRNRLRTPPSLFGQRILLPSRVYSACTGNSFRTGSTPLRLATGSKPCSQTPNIEQQVCLTEQATCSVLSSPDESERPFIT
ncbi:hypothetical protein Taro_015807 [Colocasia esculenta]|uniref:Uncharacterized protein n=1 Tax=Colocasia esculenta TaxID=4460 RepID=A0A843UNA7_COLES|nr:hypothetical protein [Colocasia esculenta]